jgi:hypothetical protein
MKTMSPAAHEAAAANLFAVRNLLADVWAVTHGRSSPKASNLVKALQRMTRDLRVLLDDQASRDLGAEYDSETYFQMKSRGDRINA